MYNVSRIQQRKRYVKLRYPNSDCSDHQVTAESDSPNSIHAFIRFEEEEGYEELFQCHFRLIDLTQKELHTMRAPAILDDDNELQDTTFL